MNLDVATLLGTAWALAMDAFAVSASVAVAVPRLTRRHLFRLAWHFGLFQAGMTVVGGYGGSAVSALVAQVDHWLAFGLLFVLGLRMISGSGRSEDRGRQYDPTRGWTLVGLSVATSIDALAVGVSYGLIGVPIWAPAAVIGAVALLLSLAGCYLGERLGTGLGRWAERLGGMVLMGIGTRILVQHLQGMG